MATATVERLGTETGTAREPTEETPRRRLMPLRIERDDSAPGHKIKVVRYHSGIDENRGVRNATMIEGLPPYIVRGENLTLADIEAQLLERNPFSDDRRCSNRRYYVNGFVLSDDVGGFSFPDQGGDVNIIIKAANFYTLANFDSKDAEREYELDEQKRAKERR